MPIRSGSTSSCRPGRRGSAAGPRRSAPAGSSPPWWRGPGWCRRRSGPRASSPGARRSSAGPEPGRRSPAGPVAARSRRWAWRCARGRPPGTCPVRARGRPGWRPRAAPRPGVRHQQVGGHRHGVLGVEDDLVPAIPVAGGGLEHLEVERHRVGGRARAARRRTRRRRSSQAANRRGLPSGSGSSCTAALRRGHPLIPGRVIARRWGEDEVARPRRQCSCGSLSCAGGRWWAM